MKNTIIYSAEELDISPLVESITTNHKSSSLWYDLFKTIELEDIEISGLGLPEFGDLSTEYDGSDTSMFVINQAIHFCEEEALKAHYILAKCIHIFMLHGELDYNYDVTSPYLLFLNNILESNPYHLAAAYAKVSILHSNQQQGEYDQYKEWLIANIDNLIEQKLPEELQTARITGEEALSSLVDFLDYYPNEENKEGSSVTLIGEEI